MGNVGNFIVFSVGAYDAETLSHHFRIPQEQIMQIGRYESLAKILVNGFDSLPFTLRTLEAPRLENPRVVESVINRMHELYWVTPKDVLEEVEGRYTRLVQKAMEARKSSASAAVSDLSSKLPRSSIQRPKEDLASIVDTISDNELDKFKQTVEESFTPEVRKQILDTFRAMVREKHGITLSDSTVDRESYKLFAECNDKIGETLEGLLTEREAFELGQEINEPDTDQLKAFGSAASYVPDLQERLQKIMLDFKVEYMKRKDDVPKDTLSTSNRQRPPVFTPSPLRIVPPQNMSEEGKTTKETQEDLPQDDNETT